MSVSRLEGGHEVEAVDASADEEGAYETGRNNDERRAREGRL